MKQFISRPSLIKNRKKKRTAKNLLRSTIMTDEDEFAVREALQSDQTPNPQNLLRLQSLVGNRTVGRLMEKPHNSFARAAGFVHPAVQLQGEKAGQKTREQTSMAEIDAILATIPSPPKVPAFEAITSTTGAEYSYLDWEKAMEKTWHRERLSFTGAARGLAGKQETGRQISTKSPTIKPEVPYARRWTLNLIATNYKKRKKALAHVSNFLKKGSPFEQAQAAESDRVLTVNNPSGADMKSQIYDAILNLSADLPAGQNGELVVYFSGHGTSGRILGVDWNKIYPPEMKAMADFAQDWGVHIVYILDTCRAGQMVAYPQAKGIADAEARFAKLPEKQKKALSEQADLAHKLGHLTFNLETLTVEASEVARYIKKYTPANRMKMMKSLSLLSNDATNLRNFLREGKIPSGAIRNQADLEKAIGDLTMTVLLAFSGGDREVNKAFRAAASLIGHLNTAINTLVEQINSKLGTSA